MKSAHPRQPSSLDSKVQQPPPIPQRDPFCHSPLATSLKLSWVSKHLGSKWPQQNSGGYKTFDLNSQRAPLFHLTTTSQFKQQFILYRAPSPACSCLPVTAARGGRTELKLWPDMTAEGCAYAHMGCCAAGLGGGLLSPDASPAVFLLTLPLMPISIANLKRQKTWLIQAPLCPVSPDQEA